MLRCPSCGGSAFRSSRRRWYDFLLLIPPRRAYRCEHCKHRFAVCPWNRPARLRTKRKSDGGPAAKEAGPSEEPADAE
jgi:hypothetical protein